MYGTHPRSLDTKNRVVIPANFREELGDIFFITFGPHNVLEMRSEKEFIAFSEKFNNSNLLDADLRKLWRILSSRTVQLSVDKLGRVILPKMLLDLAAIKKELSFIGMGNICEIWSQELFDKDIQQNGNASEITNLVEKLSKKGIVL
ncbi:division/cell wall cluster transcriptional repressor MraZ [Mycoplasma iguanae]|uniref:Transcriptional regulator MraZ n=1 Tax=Mycoplasma iguanae TaxID=292461 RepID=A0ABY5R8Y1_9MOLU|nr:division/cell wall cluster transcriptional repressor MraZ [Mycoplasma iguanae]UVD81964.1 division/cell wall cluster transcriptional repressor MraZ [Mycoplasma iguanae]